MVRYAILYQPNNTTVWFIHPLWIMRLQVAPLLQSLIPFRGKHTGYFHTWRQKHTYVQLMSTGVFVCTHNLLLSFCQEHSQNVWHCRPTGSLMTTWPISRAKQQPDSLRLCRKTSSIHPNHWWENYEENLGWGASKVTEMNVETVLTLESAKQQMGNGT